MKRRTRERLKDETRTHPCHQLVYFLFRARVRRTNEVGRIHRRVRAVRGIAEEKRRLLRGPRLPRVPHDATVSWLAVLVTSASEDTVKMGVDLVNKRHERRFSGKRSTFDTHTSQSFWSALNSSSRSINIALFPICERRKELQSSWRLASERWVLEGEER